MANDANSKKSRLQEEAKLAIAEMAVKERVNDFVRLRGPAFFRAMGVTIGTILSRDPRPEAEELTIFDRGLLALTDDGQDLRNVEVVYYCLLHFYHCDLRDPNPDFSAFELAAPVIQPARIEPKPDLFNRQTLPSSPARVNVQVSRDAGTNLQRLLDTYEQARTEYLNVARDGNERTLRAAKYLRDTAENLSIFLDDTNIDEEKRREIQTMFERANRAVQQLTGGKLRKFDNGYSTTNQARQRRHGDNRRNDNQGYRNVRRSNSPVNDNRSTHRQVTRVGSRAVSPTVAPMDTRSYNHHIEGHGHVAMDDRQDMTMSVDATYSSSPTYYGGQYAYGPNGPGGLYPNRVAGYGDADDAGEDRYQYVAVPDTADDVADTEVETQLIYADPNTGKKKNKGRGHRDVPYGYREGRQVDSYKPDQA